MQSKAAQAAASIKQAADQYGWSIEVRGSVLTITKRISGREEFVTADSEYYGILSCLPTTSPGSVWGTDGGGVGAMHAINSGVFRMNKSGGSKRVLKALEKACNP